jgi:hypothetical protein
MAVGMYLASQRFYRVEYEWNKVLKIAGSAAVLFVTFKLMHLPPLDVTSMIVKFGFIVAFGAALVFFKVIDSREIAEIKSIAQKIVNRSSTP